MPAPLDDDTTAAGAGRRAGIDRDDIVECAISLVEAGGAEALTMRKLAADLGVTTTTIYWHVGGRDELITAMVSKMSSRQAQAAIEGDTPRQRVMAAARQVWRNALDHPNLTALAHQAGASALLQIDTEKALVAELEAAGLIGEEARDALRGILLCVGGFLVLGLRTSRDNLTSRDPEARSTQDLWTEVDDGFEPATLDALRGPLDLHALFETTLTSVVDSFVPDVTHPPERTP